MTTTFASLCLALLSSATDSVAQTPDSLSTVEWNWGLAPGHNRNGAHPENVRNRMAMNLAMNDAGEIDGVDLSLGANRTRNRMKGLQVSGGANLVEGDVRGAQVSTVNLAQGDVEGFQGAFLVNLSQRRFHGLQASGLANVATGPLSGLQWSSSFNHALSVSGAQIAPVNHAGDVSGLQLGMVNIGGTVHGLQLGWVNVADSVDGAAIGLLSFARNIDHDLDVWVTESRLTNIGMVTGTEHFYTLLAFSATHPDDEEAYGMTVGLGTRWRGQGGWLAMDAIATHLIHEFHANHMAHHRSNDGEPDIDANQVVSLRLSAGWQVLSHLALYSGVSGNLLVSGQSPGDQKYLQTVDTPRWETSSTTRLWPGLFFGVRI